MGKTLMSGIGFGANYSKLNSQSSSLGYSNSNSNSLGIQSTDQNVAFAPFFASLYGNAGNAAANAADNVPGLQGQAGQLFSGGLDFLSQLHDLGSEDNTGDQLDALKSSIGDFYNTTLMPGVANEGVAAGNLGGGRDAVAASLAAKTAGNAFSTGAAQILGNAASQRIAANTAGLNATPGVYNLAQQGAQAGLNPYLALAQILGGPTTLTTSRGYNAANAVSNSFDASQSTSQGRTFGFNIGI